MSTKTQNTLLGVVAGVSILALTSCSGASSDSVVFHYATYSSADSDQSKTVQRWAEDVEDLTDGEVSFQFHYSESLVGAEESAQAALDGRVDFAQVGSGYAASDFPMYLVSELPFETDNPEAHMRALQRLYEENGEYREDIDRQGLRQLYPLPVGNAVVGTQEPVSSAEDFNGLSLRASGRLAEVLMPQGVNPVAMTAPDVYESMERGIIDGYTNFGLSNLETFGLATSTPYLTDPGIGAYGSSLVVVNEDVYQDLSEDHQAALEEASANAIDYGLEELSAEATSSCEQAQAADTDLSEMPAEEVDALREGVNVAEEWSQLYADRDYDTDSVLTDYRAFLEAEGQDSSYRDGLTSCIGGEE